ncbi:MAG: hypothetical protein SGPRY_013106 [Prymnesium sp.]
MLVPFYAAIHQASRPPPPPPPDVRHTAPVARCLAARLTSVESRLAALRTALEGEKVQSEDWVVPLILNGPRAWDDSSILSALPLLLAAKVPIEQMMHQPALAALAALETADDPALRKSFNLAIISLHVVPSTRACTASTPACTATLLLAIGHKIQLPARCKC